MFVPAGLNGSLLMQGAQTRISAALKDVVVLDVDPRSVHKKVSVHDASIAPFSQSQEHFSCFVFICVFPPLTAARSPSYSRNFLLEVFPLAVLLYLPEVAVSAVTCRAETSRPEPSDWKVNQQEQDMASRR